MKPFMKIACCVAICLSLLGLSTLSMSEEIKNQNTREQTVRVQLTRIGGRERLDFTLTAPYHIENDRGVSLALQPNNEVSFQIKNESIYLYYHEMVLELGRTVELKRILDAVEAQSGLYLTNYPALYMGDMALEIVDGKLRAVLSLHVEDYLLGVIPHEMGDSFPLEALKAQAIAARTYALKHQGRYEDYDLVDNTNDQAFKGYLTGYPLSEQAVEETRGICGFYQDELAQCFYSASNGGQTELVQDVWDDRGAYEYYAFGEDPYDLENPESMVKSFDIFKQYTTDKEAPLVLKQMVAEHVNSDLKNATFHVKPEEINIQCIDNVSVQTPSQENSRHMTQLHLEMQVQLPIATAIADSSPEEVYLFDSEPIITVDAGNSVSMEEEPISFGAREIILNIPIFPNAEKLLSLSINSNYQNEIWSVAEDAEKYVIEVRRYGHGVGMSQRGAQWMALNYGMSYQEILSFYYPGMQLIRFSDEESEKGNIDEVLLTTAGPAPTVTPRPTLMPLTKNISTGQWYAKVTEIADDSSLNLRSEPSLNSDIIMRIYKGQRLLVSERCTEDGWVHVCTDSVEGYVMEKYLTLEN